MLRSVAARRGQTAFRRMLLEACGGRCAVTGCGFAPLLEAAHVRPVAEAGGGDVRNGLLLRADVHTLFDLDLLGIDPETDRVRVSPRLRGTEYEAFDGQRAALPADDRRPDAAALAARFAAFLAAGEGGREARTAAGKRLRETRRRSEAGPVTGSFVVLKRIPASGLR